MPEPRRRRPTAAGAYVFAGGFTLGMSRHLDVRAHLEDGTFGVGTFTRNFPGVPVIQKDRWGECPAVEVVYGNPPCSAWSRLGAFVRDKSDGVSWRDVKAGCSETSFGLWRSLRPKVWVMESVTQLLSSGRGFVDGVISETSVSGCATWVVLHDVKFMGVPQSRRRVFLVVSSVDLRFDLPSGELTVCGPVVDVSEPDLVIPLTPGDLHWRGEALPGRDLKKVWQKSGSSHPLTPHPTSHVLNRDEPCGTIHSDVRLIHPTEDRYLSAREMSTLCGFPKSYVWAGSESKTRAEVAKGVTPAAGEWLGGCLARSLAADRPCDPSHVTVVNYMSKSPRRADATMLRSVVRYPVNEYLERA